MLLLVSVIAGPTPVRAQTGSIEGRVTDAETDEPLPGANVVLRDTDRGTATQSDGTFALENIEPGAYTLRASLVGYRTVERGIQVRGGESTTLNI